MSTKYTWVCASIFGAIFGYIPKIWGAGVFSIWGILFSITGALFGIWIAYKMSTM